MAHTLEKRWPGVSTEITNLSRQILSILNDGEEGFQRMQEIYDYAGGSVQGLADLLFKDDILDRGDLQASPDEVTKAADAVAAMTAAHQLWQAMNDVAIQQSDRATPLRRMA